MDILLIDLLLIVHVSILVRHRFPRMAEA
jgi:hypothetical protein